MLDLVGNPNCWFFYAQAHIVTLTVRKIINFLLLPSNRACRKATESMLLHILTHLAYIANGKKTCYIVQQFHWANKRDVTLRHL